MAAEETLAEAVARVRRTAELDPASALYLLDVVLTRLVHVHELRNVYREALMMIGRNEAAADPATFARRVLADFPLDRPAAL